MRATLLPTMSVEMLELSLNRYAAPSYRLRNLGKLSTELSWWLILPLLGVGMLRYAERSDGADGRDVVIVDALSADYYRRLLSGIEEPLSGARIRVAGEGLELPGLRQCFRLFDALRVTLALPLLWPLIGLAALLYRQPVSTALSRTLVVHLRALAYFTSYPCEIYLTVQDNVCSAALYSAFHASGGRVLCAIQNGARSSLSGIGYSRFDHLFSISHHAAEVYLRTGGRFKEFEVVAPLQFSRYLEQREEGVFGEEFDVLFVDQGFPVPGIDLWSPILTPAQVRGVLEKMKRFAEDHPELRIVYLMRAYDESQREVAEAIIEWFSGTPMFLCHPSGPFGSYRAVARSRVVVTIHSTLGLEAMAMGKTTLFFNPSSNPEAEVAPPPYQYRAADYTTFRGAIEQALCGKLPSGSGKERYLPPSVGGTARHIGKKIAQYLHVIEVDNQGGPNNELERL